jgi:histidine triad (HIT) family protein
METIFEKIIRREVPAHIVYENDVVIAFLDIEPTNIGHTLVVPKKKSENMLTIDSREWVEVMEVVRFLAPRIMRAVQAQGVNIMANCGEAAGQVVPHTHVHIVPRFTGDGFKHWPGKQHPEEEMRTIAETIRGEVLQEGV